MLEKIPQSEWHNSMRGHFAGSLYNAMIDDSRIRIVVGDLGYGMLDKIRDSFPDRFLNVGAAEQVAVGICVGMSLEGLIPFCYTITSFYLRAAETIGLYLDGEQINVKLVGSGRDKDYLHDGESHFAMRAQSYLGSLDIVQFYPNIKEEIPAIVSTMVNSKKPGFLSLRR